MTHTTESPELPGRFSVTTTGLIFENLRPVLGDHAAEVNIEDLPAFIADVPVVAGRQGPASDRDGLAMDGMAFLRKLMA